MAALPTPASESDSSVQPVRHQTGLITILFTDLVGSTALKQQVGDRTGASLIQQHHGLVRELLRGFQGGEEIETAGDSFLIVFNRPSDAVHFGLLLHARLRTLNPGATKRLQDRIGIHVGEVVIREQDGSPNPKGLTGIQVDTCARVMGLAQGGQILLTRSAFDSARQMLKGEDIQGVGPLEWLNHGVYLLKGIDASLEVCEVGEVGIAPLQAPAGSEKAQRQVTPESEPVLGWRPAVGQLVPNTRWRLETKLGEGGFGEVWLGRHQHTKERRVFKFCFQADRVRFLKREMTLFRVLKERVGDHPNIVRLHDIMLDHAPFYVEMDYVEGADLRSWSEEQGGVEAIPLATRLEIVAQAADGLQAAHEAGIIHRDIKPANILVQRSSRGNEAHSLCAQSPAVGHGSQPANERSSALWSAAAKRSGDAALASKGDDSTGAVTSADATKAVSPLADSLCPRTPQEGVTVKLTDFGIGQVVSEEFLKGITRAGFTETILSDSSSSHTGTQLYMAPELLAGKPASTRSDIYSLGVVLFQLFVEDFARPVTTDWQQNVVDTLLRDDLTHCFAGNPQDRFAGAGQLAKNLRALPERRAELERQRLEKAALERAAYRRGMMRTAGLAVVVVALVTGLAMVAFDQSRKARATALREREERQRAEHSRAELQLNAYAADMKAAQVALEQNNRGQADQLLNRYRPKLGQPDLRGIEWRYLWQRSEGNELSTLEHPSLVTGVRFAPDGRTAVSDCFDGVLRVWDVASKKLVAKLKRPAHNDFKNEYFCFSPDGNWLASRQGENVVISETTSWKDVRTLHGLPTSGGGVDDIQSLAWSGDGKWLAASLLRGQTRIWRTGNWESESLEIKTDGRMAFVPNGAGLAVCGGQNIELWDVSTREKLREYRGMPGALLVAISPDGERLAAGNDNGRVDLWELRTGQIVWTKQAHGSAVHGLSFSPDGKQLATGGWDQVIYLWDLTSREKLQTLHGHLNEVWGLDFSSDNRLLVSASKDRTVRLWETRKQHEPSRWWLNAAEYPLGFTSNGKGLITINTNGLELQRWEAAKVVKRATLENPLPPYFYFAGRLALSESGTRLFFSATNGTIHSYDVETGKVVGALKVADELSDILAVSHGTRFLAGSTVGKQGVPSLLVWDAATGATVACFPMSEVNGVVAFSPVGEVIALGFQDHSVRLWDLKKQRYVHSLAGHSWTIFQLSFSPDGRYLASSSADGDARVWDVAVGQQVTGPLRGHGSGVSAVQFSSDGKTLVTAGHDHTVRFWHIPTGREMLVLRRVRGWNSNLLSPTGDLLVMWDSERQRVCVEPITSLAEIDRLNPGE